MLTPVSAKIPGQKDWRAEGYYGIKDVELIKAVGLDIVGADVEGIIKEAEDRI